MLVAPCGESAGRYGSYLCGAHPKKDAAQQQAGQWNQLTGPRQQFERKRPEKLWILRNIVLTDSHFSSLAALAPRNASFLRSFRFWGHRRSRYAALRRRDGQPGLPRQPARAASGGVGASGVEMLRRISRRSRSLLAMRDCFGGLGGGV